MQIKRIKIRYNEKKEWAASLSRSLTAFLGSHGFSISNSYADATICIGGDGTIFHYFHTNEISGVVLGIGSKTSTVCLLKYEDFNRQKLLSALKNNKIEKRISLFAKANSSAFRSINDIVIHAHDYRIITIFLKIGGRRYKFEGDGLIVSTPMGSTAYAYSAGGRVLKPTERKIQVVPVCPYKRALKPIVVGENTKIIVSADRSSDIIIDGRYVKRLDEGSSVLIKKGKDVGFLRV